MSGLFFARPTARTPEAVDWSEYALRRLGELDAWPMAASYQDAKAILALLPPSTQSLGVPIAIGYAFAMSIPTAIIFDRGGGSPHLDFGVDWIRIWTQRDMDQALVWLKGRL